MAVLMLVNHQSSHFYAEFISRTQLSSAPKGNILIPHLPKILFFFLFQKILFFSVKYSPSYTKIRCRAKLFLHRSLPEPKVKLFPLHGIETKLNLLCQDAKLSSETRQTVQQPLVSTQRPVASQLGGKDSILIGSRGFSEKGSVLP
ncbi:hypothetical protein AVEN_243574-1 [Araneus ventricosus]|uniref:Uncharacterized protein n=1 Tax=Araneus ventricosus TaxID=182803 RepID=A0A4Y2A4T2_ARAVE|nr:hypothetical protein AVEN_243574-1 [Araneus ventricosus]